MYIKIRVELHSLSADHNWDICQRR